MFDVCVIRHLQLLQRSANNGDATAEYSLNSYQYYGTGSYRIPNASQTTLATAAAPYTAFFFNQDSMKDTKIYSAHGELLYTVETDIVSNSHTIVYPADTQEKVASVKKRDIIPDVIAFGGQFVE